MELQGRQLSEVTTDTLRRVGAALSALCGGFRGGKTVSTTDEETYHLTGTLDGVEVNVFASRERKTGKGSIGLPATTPEAVVTRFFEAFDRCVPRVMNVSATLSLGFRVLKGPLVLGDTLVAPVAHGHVHGGRTDRHGHAGGIVYDHEVVFPVVAFDWSSGGDVADADDIAAVISFVLDRPVAVVGSEMVHSEHRFSTVKDAVASQRDVLVSRGCRLDEHAVDGTDLVSPAEGYESFVAALCRVQGEDWELLNDNLLSYARAWLLSEPEPGMERYEDKSVAITLWCTIVEALSPVLPTEHCPTCNSQKKGGSNERVREFLPELDPNVTWKAFNEIRRNVRNVVAHTARRQMAGLHDTLGGFFDTAGMEALGLTLRYENVSRTLARKAILHFVQRGGNAKS